MATLPSAERRAFVLKINSAPAKHMDPALAIPFIVTVVPTKFEHICGSKFSPEEGRFIWRLWGSNEVTDVCTTCHSCCSSILVNLRSGSVTQAEKDCGLDEVNLERAAGPELIL
ncbi:hypothetical protein MDA_GLEAN10018017 [Myotis davidii]|uniref:Uncharacterized protein n=1 Tax=Myotis davidii TaxID=225400 RepID=L5LUE6_MYODS|nr:hypothetical protein MDA_GLEAN10018017 [Myotis davidii]